MTRSATTRNKSGIIELSSGKRIKTGNIIWFGQAKWLLTARYTKSFPTPRAMLGRITRLWSTPITASKIIQPLIATLCPLKTNIPRLKSKLLKDILAARKDRKKNNARVSLDQRTPVHVPCVYTRQVDPAPPGYTTLQLKCFQGKVQCCVCKMANRKRMQHESRRNGLAGNTVLQASW